MSSPTIVRHKVEYGMFFTIIDVSGMFYVQVYQNRLTTDQGKDRTVMYESEAWSNMELADACFDRKLKEHDDAMLETYADLDD